MKREINGILEGLNEKAALKQLIFRNTAEIFSKFRKDAAKIVDDLVPKVLENRIVEVSVQDISPYEFHLKFSGDTLVFMMHTNVFTFPLDHHVSKSKYVQEDESRAYFGMIQIYNFLSDSLKFNRMADVGYLLGRIFVNLENHFFADGERQLDFLYKEIGAQAMNDEAICTIIEQSMLYCLNFDLYVPPIEYMREITIEQKNYSSSSNGLATGKRLGFQMQTDRDIKG